MVRKWREEIGWRADGIFENACIGSYASKLFTKFFSLLFLRKEFVKKFFYDPFYFFLPPKKRERSGALVMAWHNGLDLSFLHYCCSCTSPTPVTYVSPPFNQHNSVVIYVAYYFSSCSRTGWGGCIYTKYQPRFISIFFLLYFPSAYRMIYRICHELTVKIKFY